MKNRNLQLEKLAEGMALNCMNVSLSSALNDEAVKSIHKNKLLADFERHKPRRFIVVIGAGASFDACNKIPMGKKAAKMLRKQFGKTPAYEELIEREINRLVKIYNLDGEDFETVLLAISKFFPVKLVEEISKLYDHKYYPSLTYELLAHMLKHRFIDCIVNFNFDELLDQAIEDELVEGEYFKVVTDGDVQNNLPEMIFDGGLKLPIYIKPHGTVSHKSTMKYTGEDYFGLPRDIHKLLETLISGDITHHSHPKVNDVPVDILAIGFNMQSFEFNSIIKEKIPEGSNLYFFKTSEPEDDDLLKKEGFYSPSNFFQVATPDNKAKWDLGEWMLSLWNKIEHGFEEKYTPRNVLRHQLIAKLFQHGDALRTANGKKAYLQDRTYMELALSIAKYKGFLSISQLARDRFGKYFRLYIKECGKKESIVDLCKRFGFEDFAYGNKAMVSRVEGFATEEKTSLTFTANNFDAFYSKIIKALDKPGILSRGVKNKLKDEEVEKLFKDTLRQLLKDQDKEVCPNFEGLYSNIFSDPKIIKTDLALNYFTQQCLNEVDWNYLLVVAESGEWALKNHVSHKIFNKEKVIRMVVADDVYISQLNEAIETSGNEESEIKRLQWWRHNQHMSIFIDRKKNGQIEILKSIYFTRRLRNSHINPVVLGEKDSQTLLQTFFAYYLKCENGFDDISKTDIKRLRKTFFLKSKDSM